MNEKLKCILKGLGLILFQALAVLVLIFIGLWLFAYFIMYGGPSRT